jgi:hypothetical protein
LQRRRDFNLQHFQQQHGEVFLVMAALLVIGVQARPAWLLRFTARHAIGRQQGVEEPARLQSKHRVVSSLALRMAEALLRKLHLGHQLSCEHRVRPLQVRQQFVHLPPRMAVDSSLVGLKTL